MSTRPLFLPTDRPSLDSGHVPALNGLRALSVLIVLVSHWDLESYVPGGLGVGVFFVISGFLITRLLLAENDEFGSIDVVRFLARRVMRLYPPLLTMVSVVLIYFVVQDRPFDTKAIWSVLFYYANYFRIFDPQPLSNLSLTHTWSLSIEEHFYLVYPPLLMMFLARRWRLISGLVGGCVLSLVLRCVYYALWGDASSSYIYNATETRMEFIFTGALIAVLCSRTEIGRLLSRIDNRLILCAGIVLILLSILIRDPVYRSTLRFTTQSVGLLLLVPVLVYGPHLMRIKTAINNRYLDWLGRVSYDLYLLHPPIIAFVIFYIQQRYELNYLTKSVGFGIGTIASVLAAACSYYLVDAPTRRVRARLRPRRRPAERTVA